MVHIAFGIFVAILFAGFATAVWQMIRILAGVDRPASRDSSPVVHDHFTDARFRRVVREAGVPLCLDADECGAKKCGCWMTPGPAAVASLLDLWRAHAGRVAADRDAARRFALASGDRIFAAHEVLGRLAERRAVVLTERGYCPLG